MSDATRAPGGAIRVGDFVLDARSGELRGESGRQTLSAQPLNVLLALLERPGGVVTRDELRARLWPADTYVDFEHGLNAVVKRLRDALGDAADTPRYIETVPRRGYRLVAGVAMAAPAGLAAGDSATIVTPAAALRRHPVTLLAVAALALLATGAAAYFFLPWRSAEAAFATPSPAADAQLTRLTFGPGLQTDATWSPDGRRIAFAADHDGNFDLFIQSVDGGDPIRLTRSPANETQPAWSPDGARLAFLSDEDGGGLFTIGVTGGGAVRRISRAGAQPTWMPGGRDIAYAGNYLQTIHVVRADGGEPPREILKGQLANGYWSSFSVHPDGRIGVFGLNAAGQIGFYVSDRDRVRLGPSSSVKVLPDAWKSCYVRARWNGSGDTVYVEAAPAGVAAIWRVPVDPVTQAWGTPVLLTTRLASAEFAAVSPDGGRVAFTSAHINIRAWVFSFDADRAAPPGEGRPLTDEDASVFGVSVSADGSSVFYGEARPGRPAIRGIRVKVDTGETAVLVDDAPKGFVPSPDGRSVSYPLQRPPGAPRAPDVEYALAWRGADDGQERLLTPWERVILFPTDVRPDDGGVLATQLTQGYGGPAQLVEVSAGPAAVPRRVLLDAPRKQFWQGHYSPDGRRVAFVVASLGIEGPTELGIAPSDSSSSASWTRVAADHAWPDKPRWSPDGGTLYFLSRAAGGFFALWGVRIDRARGAPAGPPFRVAQFDSPRFHIDPDSNNCEMGIARGRLVLPMRTVKGSIWVLSMPGT